MATYGFRIHSIAPHFQRSQNYLKVHDVSSAASEKDAVEVVHSQLLALQGILRVGTPTYFISQQEEDVRLRKMDEANDLPYFTVLKVERSGRVIEVLVETGREADHDGILSRDGTRDTARRKAAVRVTKVIFVFPTKGAEAFLVSEVRGRTYAGELLIAWLTRTAQRDAVTVDGSGNKSEGPWLNWKLTPRIDGERLDNILAGSSDHSFRLKRHVVTAQGGRETLDLELVQFGLKRTTIEKVQQVLINMSNRRHVGTKEERRKAAAKDVVELVQTNVKDAGFTDGELSFKENGKLQTVTSETVDELFIYPLGSKRPEMYTLKARAAIVIQSIAPTMSVQANLSIVPPPEEEGD